MTKHSGTINNRAKNGIWALKATKTSSGTVAYGPSLNVQEKGSIACIVSVSNWHLCLCSSKKGILLPYGVPQSSISSLDRVQKSLRILVANKFLNPATNISRTFPHSFCIPLVRNKSQASVFFWRTFSVYYLLHDITITTIFTCSSLGLTFMFHSWLPKLYLFHCNALPRVAPRPCIGWTSL